MLMLMLSVMSVSMSMSSCERRRKGENCRCPAQSSLHHTTLDTTNGAQRMSDDMCVCVAMTRTMRSHAPGRQAHL